MSQYAFGRYLSVKNHTDLKLDISAYAWYKVQPYLLDNFNINASVASIKEIANLKGNRILSRIGLGKPSYIIEHDMKFDPTYMCISDNSYLEGHWGSERYFKEISDTIRSDFTLKCPLRVTNRIIVSQIAESQNPISIHFRRGDYVTDANANKIHGTCSIEYYSNALNYISDKIGDKLNLFIFSDDINWVKQSFKPKFQCTYVDINKPTHGYNDLYLMSRCDHHIIANSSFSWWGAWLGRNPEKIVISPKKWFNVDYDTSTILPDGWLAI